MQGGEDREPNGVVVPITLKGFQARLPEFAKNVVVRTRRIPAVETFDRILLRRCGGRARDEDSCGADRSKSAHGDECNSARRFGNRARLEDFRTALRRGK
jgi:hypothetical protein